MTGSKKTVRTAVLGPDGRPNFTQPITRVLFIWKKIFKALPQLTFILYALAK